MTLAAVERKKYEKAWNIDAYHAFSPAEAMLPLFKQMVRGRGTLIDIGCGTGRASQKLADMGWTVTMLDHVAVKGRPKLPFIKATVWNDWRVDDGFDQGFCCDVMEHIPPEMVDRTLDNIMWYCHRVFFSINFLPDHFGGQVGHPLHLTVKPFEWWVEKLGEFGTVANARDLLGEGAFDVRSNY